MHTGVPPEHVSVSCHCPFESQVCATSVTPVLHRFAPVVHTLQFPDEHVPVSTPTAHEVPSALFPIPHAYPMHVACKHGFAGVVHCPAVRHCTHSTLPVSQYGSGATQLTTASYCPLLLHVFVPFPSHTSVPGVHAQHTPVPLHVPPGQLVPSVFGANSHEFDVHTASRHGFDDA